MSKFVQFFAEGVIYDRDKKGRPCGVTPPLAVPESTPLRPCDGRNQPHRLIVSRTNLYFLKGDMIHV